MIADASANMVVFDLEGLAEFEAAGPCLKVLAETGAARVVLVGLRKGQELPEQQAPSQLQMQVLRGTARLHTGDTVRAVEMGTLLLLEEHVPHRVEAIDDCVLLITLTPSPVYRGVETGLYGGPQAFISRQTPRGQRRARGRALPTVPTTLR